MAAQSLHHSRSALGDSYRRMRTNLGVAKAIAAVAHRLPGGGPDDHIDGHLFVSSGQ